jgi:hypothetical protein
MRSCVACRHTTEKRSLLRFVAAPDGTVVPDLQQKLPGRGAYTCLKASCLAQAVKRRQLFRALDCAPGETDAAGLLGLIKEKFQERIASYISLANKGGKVVSGSDQVQEQLKKGGVGLLFVASNISPEIGAKFGALVRIHGAQVSNLFDKERLGALIGKELRSVLAVLESGFIDPMTLEMERYRNFFEEERE